MYIIIPHIDNFTIYNTIGLAIAMSQVGEDGEPKPLEVIASSLECFDFEPLPSGEGYEARCIKGASWVGTAMVSGTIVEGTQRYSASFGRLFQYITGANARNQGISMTAPVISKQDQDGHKTMFFKVPGALDPPAPTEPTVFLEKWQDAVVYCRAFGGNDRSEERYRKELEKLAEAVRKDGKEVDTSVTLTAGFTRPGFGQQRQEVMYFAKC